MVGVCRAKLTGILLAVFWWLLAMDACAQNSLELLVRDGVSAQPLFGASAVVEGTSIAGNADTEGSVVLREIPAGDRTVTVSFIGYAPQSFSVSFDQASVLRREVFLFSEDEELDEIVISSTRGSRTFADIPTRVEFIGVEELQEKANMKPGDVRMLLNESTGIQMQQTSATSANASIRIQGLDGRYTQILKDGFPLYAGFSGGLGLLQTPPLDLKQVEIIKGSSSTLYGGGAIAGMVNLISRTPSEERDLSFLVNATNAGGLDISGFYSEDFGKVGLTFFGSRNSNAAYDPAKIDLTAIPEFTRYVVNPKLFVDFSDRTSLNVGVNITTEDRIGGDIHVIEGKGDNVHRYFERNLSDRASTQLHFSHRFNELFSMNLKSSLNRYSRVLEVPEYRFNGVQESTFSELTFMRTGERIEWIGGLNVWVDRFEEEPLPDHPVRDYRQNTIGVFVQNSFDISSGVSLETGVRGDHVVDYGFVFLPRISLLYRAGARFSSRIGGGFGYKAPTIFTEESERIQFQHVLPVGPEANDLEKSYGASWDLNYRTEIGEMGVNINHLFFYTYLDDPLLLGSGPGEDFAFTNLPGFIDTRGTETNIRLELDDFKLFLGYTFTDARVHDGGMTVQNPLTAKHRLNNVLMYEVEDQWKVGLEAYYFSRQRLNDDTYGKGYWICGFMVEKIWDHFSVFINFENFLDVRQTRFDTIYTGSVTNPVFRDIYAPVDGFVVNGGVKIRIFE